MANPNLLREALDLAWNQYGLRTELTLWGGSNRDPFKLAQVVRDVILEGRQHMVLDVEMMNEDNGLGDQEMIQMLNFLKPTNCLLALNCAMDPNTTEGDLLADFAAGATLGTVHLDRDPGKHGERWIRQPYGLRGVPGVMSHNEPIGPRSSVCETTDPSGYTMLRLEGIFYGCSGFVFHNGNCVTGLNDPAHNRQGDAWSVPGVDWMMATARAADALLPVDVRHWAKSNQHGGWSTPGYGNLGNQITADAIWSDGLTADGHGCDRCYGARSPDGTATISMVSDVVSFCDVRAERAMHLRAYEVRDTQNPVADADLQAGATVRLGPGNFVVSGIYS